MNDVHRETMRPRVRLIEDDASQAIFIQRTLELASFDVKHPGTNKMA